MEPITVIMTCFKEGERLLRAARSLDAQVDTDFDLVVVDDASPDPATHGACAQLAERRRTTVRVRGRNGGLAVARNDGFRLASRGICVLLDGDDTLPPTAVAAIRRGFASRSDVDFVFGDYLRRDIEAGTSSVIRCADLSAADGLLSPQALAGGNWKLLGASPCRRSAWERVGGYSTRFPGMQDVDFWMRVLLADGKGLYLPEVIYDWHRSAQGMNATTPDKERVGAFAENVAFFDRFGDGHGMRRHLPRRLWMAGYVVEASALARALLGGPEFTLAPERILGNVSRPMSAAACRLARSASALIRTLKGRRG